MSRLPIVVLHGYSDRASSFHGWRAILREMGYDARSIHLGDYVSQSNEITIKDIAEGFDRALREEAGLDAEEPFDALVHSTGGLVIREWLVTYGSRRKRLKRLVALAPANFGSPLAHRGQSWLASAFKGKGELGPDFMETGHLVLSGLELGSSYTWDLAERDLLGPKPAPGEPSKPSPDEMEPIFGESEDSPFPFVLIGLDDYGPFKRVFIDEPGTDGTVRWAGAAMNSRKIEVDLTREPGESKGGWFKPAEWHNIDIPLVLLPGLNHGTIVSAPSEQLIEMVRDALRVENMDQYRAWSESYSTLVGDRLERVGADRWQQFVVRVIDERGDPVPDYYLEFAENGELIKDFSLDVHPFMGDESFRCFHVNLSKLKPEQRTALELRLVARSGTELVAYHGAGSQVFTRGGARKQAPEGDPAWDACLDMTSLLDDEKVKLFFPYTTTLLQVRLNREPMPPTGVSHVLRFAGADDSKGWIRRWLRRLRPGSRR
jgi:pimeloyl-ACP methyl ester carboxylesterase